MKIVLTGGPSAGKTSLAQVLSRTYAEDVAIVPEAASILFSGGFPRFADDQQRKSQQRAIYFVQREVETSIALEYPTHSLICDRGSLDSVAYWPGPPEDFFHSVNTTLEREIARYEWVVHLDTARAKSYRESSIRHESSAEAILLNERVKEAWSAHPQRVVIPNSSSFPTKIRVALNLIKAILEKRSLKEVRELVAMESLG